MEVGGGTKMAMLVSDLIKLKKLLEQYIDLVDGDEQMRLNGEMVLEDLWGVLQGHSDK